MQPRYSFVFSGTSQPFSYFPSLSTEVRLTAYNISSAIKQSFSFQNNPKNLNPSYKTDLDILDCKTRIIAKFNWTDLVIYSHSREGKTLSYSRIYTVYSFVVLSQ